MNYPSLLLRWQHAIVQSRLARFAAALSLLIQRSPLVQQLNGLKDLLVPRFADVAKFAVPATVTFGGIHAATGASVEVIPIQGSTNPTKGTVGKAFVWAFDTKGEDSMTYTFTGTMPPGIVWSKTISKGASTLRGTPTQAGTFQIGITGWEHSNRTGDKTPVYDLTINIEEGSLPLPNITTQPVGGSFDVGGALSLKVVASGEGLKYQWQKDGEDIVGATSTELAIPKLALTDIGNYRVVISNSVGTVTSAAVNVAVKAVAPIVSTQPKGGNFAPDAALALSVVASGSGLTYQWQKDGKDIAEATRAELKIAKLALSDAGSYRVIVTNGAGNVASEAALVRVLAPLPTIATQPKGGDFETGAALALSVAAKGIGLQYQWRKDEKDIAGANSAEFSLAKLSLEDAGNYSVIVSNAGANSDEALVQVVPVGSPEITTQPKSGKFAPDAALALSVVATGTGLKYQWQKDEKDIAGATGAELKIAKLALSDAGRYRAIITNDKGTVPSDAALVIVAVAGSPDITTQPQGGKFSQDAALALSVVATGTGLKYQWQKDGKDIAGATSAELKIAKLALSDAGAYGVTVTNDKGSLASDLSPVQVLGLGAPEISTQPEGGKFAPDAALALSVAAVGNGLKYQWQKDGKDIAGATSAELKIAKLALADAGSYRVLVSGASVVSDPAVVKVSTQKPVGPAITTQPTGGEFLVDAALSLKVLASGENLKFQWRKDEKDIAGATTDELKIAKLALSDAGSYSVIVRNDKGETVSEAAVIKVSLPSTKQDLETWRKRFWKDAELADIKISGPLVDSDGDGAVNLFEFAHGTDPTKADATGLLKIRETNADGKPVVTIELPTSPDADGVELFFEQSEDLTAKSWKPLVHGEAGVVIAVKDKSLSLTLPRGAKLPAFLRAGVRVKAAAAGA